MVFKNGEVPPQPQNTAEREFYENRGLVFLDDDFEFACINAFFKSIEHGEFGLKLNVDLVKEYAKFYETPFLDFYEILSVILNAVNKEQLKRLEK
ncbi:hypothetical protein OFO10_06020 [Campylobacter sp. VBCF_06 NA8]|uniref:hypothetical protein n=1 Tax=Campylobacter sp. VBCF_06 NA8 TaxID=2983822 RepID=UPI0022E9F153|nr:hypothetical protein [Campylobacter sp. VBCF_06 NA8]MDA3046711.1 hypothetical protein [Campylobacter sp. VBCF_06 NA8]